MLRKRQRVATWKVAVSCVSLSAKRECVRRDTGVEKLDLERTIAYRTLLTNQLIEPLLLHDARAVGVDIGAMISRWSRAVHAHAESHGLAVGAGPENEVQVARLEMKHDLAGRGVQHGI